MTSSPTHEDCEAPALGLTELRERLREAEETLAAIRDGEVDAVVVRGTGGQQVYTLENADRPYRALIEQMQDGAVTISDAGLILYCNQRFASMVGVGAEKIIGTPLERVFAGTAQGMLQGLLKDPTRINAAGEHRLRRADGADVPVNVSLAKVQLAADADLFVCGVISDMTAVHRRSNELHATNERLATEIVDRRRAEDSLQLALDAAGMGSWDLDLQSNRAHRSLRHDQIFGHVDLVADWTLDDSLQQFIPEDRARVAHAFKDAETSGSIDIEARIERANDAQERWLRVNGRTFFEDGRPIRIAGVVADITERRAVEDRLRQAQKIEAIGQLTGGVAHDFNNLLQVISSGLQLVGRPQLDPERRERVLKGMRQAVDRGSGLSRQLLAFSRRQALNPEVVDLRRHIEGMRELLDRSLRGDVKVCLELSPDIWPVEVDPGELELVILNLAVNARDAMPNGGGITIRATNAGNPMQEGLRGDYVLLEVIDTGTGMSPEVMAHAFEPFFTTKEIGKGSGLGLAQTHGFAQASKGAVRLRSEPGAGTTVALYLPRTDKSLLAIVAPAIDFSKQAPESKASGFILLVEDDDEVAALTTEMIDQLGYKTTRVATADAALGALANGRSIDIVFSDVMMPGSMNGVELAKEIKRRRPELPVLLTSGFVDAAKREAEANNIRIIPKPFLMEQLREAFTATQQHRAK